MLFHLNYLKKWYMAIIFLAVYEISILNIGKTRDSGETNKPVTSRLNLNKKLVHTSVPESEGLIL